MFDCFMLNDELDLLELRLNILYPFIEKFVIVESDKTHSGLSKELHFIKNKSRFERFLSKIITLQYSGGLVANGVNAWGNENWQRNKLLDALETEKPSDGLLFISDVDEIPKPEKLFEAKCLCCKSGDPVVLGFHHCMYFMNFASDTPYRGPYLYNPDKAKDFQARFGNIKHLPTDIRWHVSAVGYENDFATVNEAGWHFSTVGNIDQIRKKIASFAHIEFNKEEIVSEEHLMDCIAKGIPYFEKTFKFQKDFLRFSKKSMTFLPDYVQSNIAKYREYILF